VRRRARQPMRARKLRQGAARAGERTPGVHNPAGRNASMQRAARRRLGRTARSVSAAPVSASEAASLSSSPSTARSSAGSTRSTTCRVSGEAAPARRAARLARPSRCCCAVSGAATRRGARRQGRLQGLGHEPELRCERAPGAARELAGARRAAARTVQPARVRGRGRGHQVRERGVRLAPHLPPHGLLLAPCCSRRWVPRAAEALTANPPCTLSGGRHGNGSRPGQRLLKQRRPKK